ncbi:Sugar phosphate permease [Paramicrobacterium humi]|uniref:Sugar phosphate permease n=1 Tax=Paramicrobacterium humi TaxID=640635 RepID=A0A1H4L2H0_9MICO|nr:MFS transporter [Microbacterium humi]SEB64913.1 Sugar phosphate permease [Microbacterium humi]
MSIAELQLPPSALHGKKRVLTSAFVGTTVEWYDFYLYGTAAALIFNTQFFPAGSDVAGTLGAFATFAVGFLARPAGGIIAGHLGDRIGRKSLLVVSLITMGAASTAIGLLPNYATIGVFAVIGLVLLRLLQGLACGAEWGGSALLSVEHAPSRLRGFFGSFTQVGSAAGMLLATGSFAVAQALTTDEQFQAFGWRLPFLASAVLVVVGIYIRLGVEDAPAFRKLKVENRIAKAPVWEVLRYHKRALLVTIGLRLAQPALFAILAIYLINYLAARRDDTTSGVTAVLIGSAVGLASGPLWGWASDKWGRRNIALVAIAGIGLFIWPFFWFLDNGPLALLPIAMLLGMNILHDAIYGPQAAWFAEQFPVHVRYTGVSLGCQIGTVLSGGLTPVIAASLLLAGNNTPWLICAYISGLAVLSFIAALAAKDPVGDRLRDSDAHDEFEVAP